MITQFIQTLLMRNITAYYSNKLFLDCIFNKIVYILLSYLLLTNCAIPRSEDVNRAAKVFLREQFHENFTIWQTKSTLNEGNMNVHGFEVVASPVNQPRAMFAFSVDYRDGKLILKDRFLKQKYIAAQERVRHSKRLIAVLEQHLDEFLAVLNPNIWNDAVLEIYLFRLPTEADKLAYFQRIATALREFKPFPEYQKITLRLRFFPEAVSELPSDRIIDKYFRYQTGHSSWLRRHTFAIRIDDLDVYDPPEASELLATLKVNSTATLVLKARTEAQKQVSAWLRQHFPTQTYQVGNHTILTKFAGALHRLRFEFKACTKGLPMRRCPPEHRRILAAVYDLNNGRTKVSEIRTDLTALEKRDKVTHGQSVVVEKSSNLKAL